MRQHYAGTRLERQELNGKILTDNPGALWTEELLERCRLLSSPSPDGEGDQVKPGGGVEGTDVEGSRETLGLGAGYPSTANIGGSPPHGSATGRISVTRLVIAVDPPTGAGTCGIVACAKDEDGKAQILANSSVAEQSPEAWSRVVANAAALWTALHPNAPLLAVAESNQGGLMVQSVLRISDPTLKIKLVPAIQAKPTVAMLFEAGRVWGLTELMLQKERAAPQIRSF
ncbi:MAG TPA: hypothetical protein VE053_03920 [Allosphingosinicella sp.]|nr:hypothetical protein [Allosphingosinicella sp.]